MSGSVYSATPHRIAISAPPLCVPALRALALPGATVVRYIVSNIWNVYSTLARCQLSRTKPNRRPTRVSYYASPRPSAQPSAGSTAQADDRTQSPKTKEPRAASGAALAPYDRRLRDAPM